MADLIPQNEIFSAVGNNIKALQKKGDLIFPADYVPVNALKAAWLIIQETVDLNKKPALEVCTPASVCNALLKMAIQGLNPDKNQCYFIVYGNKLTLQRSYFGSIALAKRVNPQLEDIIGTEIYEGDEFEYRIIRGAKKVTKHVQKIQNISKNKLFGAYATAIYKDGREESTIMTFDEIKQAWKQSKMNPIDENGNVKPGSTHSKFTADMAKRTVINKACKSIINASSDKSLLSKIIEETATETTDAEVEQEITEEANTVIVDIPDTEYEVSEDVNPGF